jgi:hypothetical protein
MANRKTTKARRKPVRKTRAEVKSIDEMHYGLEPSGDYFDNKGWHEFFGWYNYMYDRKKVNQVIISYAKKFKYKNASKFSKMYVPGTLAYFIRGLENGVKFPQVDTKNEPLPEGMTGNAYVQAYVHEELKNWNKKAHNLFNMYLGAELVDKDKVVKKRKTVQENIDAKVQSILGEVDHAIDVWDVEPFDMYKYLVGLNISATVANKIPEQYQEIIDEVKEARDGKSKQLKEAYSHMTKGEKGDFINFITRIQTDSLRYAENHKPIRKAKKAKQLSATDKVKNLKFLDEDVDNKITSIDPSDIIGAQTLCLFNTKTNQLSYYHAMDRGGLNVKGTTIHNFDEETSGIKKLGAKTTHYLDRVLGGGKIVLNNTMNEINSKASKVTGRVNNNMIILKVI